MGRSCKLVLCVAWKEACQNRSGRDTSEGRSPESRAECAATQPPAQGCPQQHHLYPLLHVRLAEETVVQRVAALVRGLHRQEDPAVLRETRHMWMDPGPSLRHGAWGPRPKPCTRSPGRWDLPAFVGEISCITRGESRTLGDEAALVGKPLGIMERAGRVLKPSLMSNEDEASTPGHS